MIDSNQLDHVVQMNQLQRQFKSDEFVLIVQQLLPALQLTTSFDLPQLYDEIMNKSGKVIGKDILKLIHVLKQQSDIDKDLENQLRFYVNTISQIESKGKDVLTIGEFFVHFVLNNPKKGILTDEIQEKISQFKVISLQKLLNIIKSIQKTRSDNKMLKCNKRLKKLQSKFEQQSTFQQIGQRYYLNGLRYILQKNLIESKQLNKALGFMKIIKQELDEKQEYDQRIHQIQTNHQDKYRKLAQQLMKFQQALQQKDYIINRLQQEHLKYQQQIQMFQQKCQQDFITTITNMSQQNQRLLHQKKEAINYIKQLQEQIKGLKISIKENNVEVVVQKQKQKQSQKQQNKSNIFSNQLRILQQQQFKIDNPQMVLKNELKQAYSKIMKLRKENQDLKVEITELQTQLQAKVYVSGRQTDRTFKNLVLEEKVFSHASHTHEQARDTFLDIIRKGSFAQILKDEQIQSLSFNNYSSKKLVRSITKQHLINSLDFLNNSTLLQKFNMIQEFDFVGIQNQFLFRDLTQFLTNNVGFNRFKPVFSSFIQIIAEDDTKEKLALFHSSDKMLLCNLPKFNIKLSIGVTEIEQIIICQGVRNWIVVKLKPKTLNNMKNKPYELVISINRRKQYLKYLVKVGILELGQPQVKISFQKQQNIQIKASKKVISLSNYRGVNNLLQRSIHDGEKVFQGRIKQVCWVSRQIECLIIINTIGILTIAKTKKQDEFENIKKQVSILPYTCMQVIELSKQKRLKIVYPSIERSYLLEFQSYAETKLAKKLIEVERQKIINQAKCQAQKYLSISAGFNKLGSIQRQYSAISQ